MVLGVAWVGRVVPQHCCCHRYHLPEACSLKENRSWCLATGLLDHSEGTSLGTQIEYWTIDTTSKKLNIFKCTIYIFFFTIEFYKIYGRKKRTNKRGKWPFTITNNIILWGPQHDLQTCLQCECVRLTICRWMLLVNFFGTDFSLLHVHSLFLHRIDDTKCYIRSTYKVFSQNSINYLAAMLIGKQCVEQV